MPFNTLFNKPSCGIPQLQTRQLLPVVGSLSLAVALAGCSQQADVPAADDAPTHTSSANAVTTKETSSVTHTSQNASQHVGSTLAPKLADFQSQFSERAPEAVQQLYQRGVDDLDATGITSLAKQVGEPAPAFTLPGATGEQVALADLLNEGPVVLLWYRGGWCPYCNLTLRAYQERLDDIKGLGAQLVAISPETPDNSLDTKEKGELQFHVLSDAGNAVSKEFGIVFELPADVAAQYRQHFDLVAYNGDNSGTLPLAATYVVGQDGLINWAFLDADYRKRAEPQDVIDALTKLR